MPDAVFANRYTSATVFKNVIFAHQLLGTEEAALPVAGHSLRGQDKGDKGKQRRCKQRLGEKPEAVHGAAVRDRGEGRDECLRLAYRFSQGLDNGRDNFRGP